LRGSPAGYFVHTKRFNFSTGNLADRGRDGVPRYYYTRSFDTAHPRGATNTIPTFLSAQENNAGRCWMMTPTGNSTNNGNSTSRCRYDLDHARTTTETPRRILPSTSRSRARSARRTSERRSPKPLCDYLQAHDDWTFYGGWSSGFRSGGFNTDRCRRGVAIRTAVCRPSTTCSKPGAIL